MLIASRLPRLRAGSLVQTGLDRCHADGPVVILGVLGYLAASRPLDLLALGDDTASVLGLRVRLTRLAVVVLVLAVAGAATAGGAVVGMLAGDTVVLLGDLSNWLGERSGADITFVLDVRLARVMAALLAGAALPTTPPTPVPTRHSQAQ